MTLNASLKSRVRRLEQASFGTAEPDRAELMRVAREARLRRTPEQAAAAHCERVAAAMAELTAPDRPGDPVQAMRRRFALRHSQEQQQ